MRNKEILQKIVDCKSLEDVASVRESLNKVSRTGIFELYDKLKEKEKSIKNGLTDENINQITEDTEIYKELSTKDSYYLFDKALTKLLTENLTSILVSGQGGTGKSYTVEQKLKNTLKSDGTYFKSIEENDSDDEEAEDAGDYLFITGHSSPKGLYNLLYKNRDNRIIVFDDCDSIFNNIDSLNILKSALDTKPVRKISWRAAAAFAKDDIPNCFSFTSKIIFLTNIPKAKLDQALLTRVIFFNLYLTNEQLCERAESIKEQLLTNLNAEMQNKVLEFVKEHCNEIHNFSLRTYLKINQLISNDDTGYTWKNMILHIV